MGEKTKHFTMKETSLTYDVAVLLRKLADAMAQKKFECDCQEPPISIQLPNQVNVECELKEKVKDAGSKFKLELEVTWSKPTCSKCGD